MTFSPKALQLIRIQEGCDQPSEWPGESSGITIGPGYDLGYCSDAAFRAAWADWLDDDELDLLSTAIGVKGEAAHALTGRFTDIRISPAACEGILVSVVIPEWIENTRHALPGVERLPADAFGAVVSLCFNRGTGMGKQGEPSWDRRKEMRAIRDSLAALAIVKQEAPDWPKMLNAALLAISFQLRSMRRLWPRARGLRDRREAEAQLIESCLTTKETS